MSFKFGCAKADITPDYPCYLRGYASRNRLSDGIADRLEVGTMVFSGNRKKVSDGMSVSPFVARQNCHTAKFYHNLS